MSAINQAEIKRQVEYYLSDKNLVQDEFFRTKIQADAEGFLPLDLILKCRKIAKLGVSTAAQLVSAVEGSTEVEINEAKDQIRRIGNKPLPAYEGGKAETSAEANAEKEAKEAEKKELINYYETFEPIVFTTTCTEEGIANWRNVTEALLKQHEVNPPYCRFAKQEGNFALNKQKTTQETIDTLVSEGLKIGEHTVTIKVTDEDELKKFYELHGRHYSGIMEQKKKEITLQLKQQNKASKKEKKSKKEFDFGGEKYTDILTVKNLFKGILGRTANGQKIIAPYHDMLKALLAYHEKGEQKLENLDHFTVDIHPEFKDTRCFFAVKADGSREDFSAVKCLANLEAQLGH